jgi:Phage integrase family
MVCVAASALACLAIVTESLYPVPLCVTRLISTMPLAGVCTSPLGSATRSSALPWGTIGPCAPFVASSTTPGAVSPKRSASHPGGWILPTKSSFSKASKNASQACIEPCQYPRHCWTRSTWCTASKKSNGVAGRRALDQPLWSWSRTTAWRRVVAVMKQADISEGPHHVPKGLRHGYAIHALNKGVPLNMLSKWMGHSILEITAIYANAVGEEQQAIAARMWS